MKFHHLKVLLMILDHFGTKRKLKLGLVCKHWLDVLNGQDRFRDKVHIILINLKLDEQMNWMRQYMHATFHSFNFDDFVVDEAPLAVLQGAKTLVLKNCRFKNWQGVLIMIKCFDGLHSLKLGFAAPLKRDHVELDDCIRPEDFDAIEYLTFDHSALEDRDLYHEKQWLGKTAEKWFRNLQYVLHIM
jgi:hypothetical protein